MKATILKSLLVIVLTTQHFCLYAKNESIINRENMDTPSTTYSGNRIIPPRINGSIDCVIFPLAAKPEIYLSPSGTSVGSFYPEQREDLIINSLLLGTYYIKVGAINSSFNSKEMISGIQVVAGILTNLGIMKMYLIAKRFLISSSQ
jgi:hypothetical protein